MQQARRVRVRKLLPYPFLIVGGIIMFLPMYMMLATSFVPSPVAGNAPTNSQPAALTWA